MAVSTSEWVVFSPSVLGPVIGAAIAIIGVVISNAFENARLNKRLEKEGEEKIWQREHDLKKEIYLNAQEEIGYMFNLLINLANIDLSSGALNSPTPNLLKLQVISNFDTVKKAMSFSNLFSELFMPLLFEKYALDKIQSDSKILQDATDKWLAKMSEYNEKIAALNETGHYQPDILNTLQQSYDFYHKQFESCSIDRDKAVKFFHLKQAELIQKGYTAAQKLIDPRCELLLSMREELKTEIECEKEFQEFIRIASERHSASFCHFIEKFKEIIETDMESEETDEQQK